MTFSTSDALFHLLETCNRRYDALVKAERDLAGAKAVLSALVDYYDAVNNEHRPFPLGALPKIVDDAREVLAR